jgi:hypothetical protein
LSSAVWVPPNTGHQSRLEGLCLLGGAVSRGPIQQLRYFLLDVQSAGFHITPAEGRSSIRADGICLCLPSTILCEKSRCGGSTSSLPRRPHHLFHGRLSSLIFPSSPPWIVSVVTSFRFSCLRDVLQTRLPSTPFSTNSNPNASLELLRAFALGSV